MRAAEHPEATLLGRQEEETAKAERERDRSPRGPYVRTSRPRDRQRSPRKRRSVWKEGRRPGRGAAKRACRRAIGTRNRGPGRLCQEDGPPTDQRWECPGTAEHSERAEEEGRAPSIRKLRPRRKPPLYAGASLHAPREGTACSSGERTGRQHFERSNQSHGNDDGQITTQSSMPCELAHPR